MQRNPSCHLPHVIYNEAEGATYILAESEDQALAAAREIEGDDATVEYIGWMHRVSYPDNYDSREEWEAALDFQDDWWEGCQPPTNDAQRKNAVQAWEV